MILQLLSISKYLNLFKNHQSNPLVRPFMRVTNHLSRFELILRILNRVDSLTFQTPRHTTNSNFYSGSTVKPYYQYSVTNTLQWPCQRQSNAHVQSWSV